MSQQRFMTLITAVGMYFTLWSCGSPDDTASHLQSDISGFRLASVYQCDELVDALGATVQINQLKLHWGSVRSKVELDYSYQKGRGGLTVKKQLPVSFTINDDSSKVSFTKSSRIGPLFERSWGKKYDVFELDLRSMELSYRVDTKYTNRAPGSPSDASTLYFVTKCKKLN